MPLAAGLALFTSAGGLPEEVATLGEPVLAAGVLVPCCQLRRPLPRGVVAALPAAVGLDVGDRRIDPGAVTVRGVRWSWYPLLLVAPLLPSLAAHHGRGREGSAP